MGKHIILIHGRDIKPAEAPMRTLAKTAILRGLQRARSTKGYDALQGGRVKFTFVYYGDISNQILAAKSSAVRDKLKDRDPNHGNQPCFPFKHIESAYKLTDQYRSFSQAEYNTILSKAKDFRFLDDAADAVSLFGSLLTGGILNTISINAATADMGKYLTSHMIGSQIRERLDEILRQALLDGDDVCLLSHSMGCMVAYDVMWKYAHMSEYSDLRAQKKSVALWLTFGNPLGETGVRRNLLDGTYSEAEDKYPNGQIRRWTNVYAQDDFVSHIEKVAPAYKDMKDQNGKKLPIKDIRIYNCWVYKDSKTNKLVSNPHDMYGYLMNQSLGKELDGWLLQS